VCDLETSRMGAPYIYDISRLRVKEKNGECASCLKYSVLVFVEKNIYEMQHLEGSGRFVLYIGRTVLKG